MVKKIFCKVLFLFGVLFWGGAGVWAQDKTTINIDNAQSTRYEKDKDTGNDVIVLMGNVKLSVTKGDDKSVITADEVRYDRKTDMIYASGNVSLEQTTSSSGGQNVTANALMFNTSTLEGVFDDGRVVQVKSDAINLPSGSTLIVASDVFGRSQSNTIAFKNGDLTFCDDEDPHWKIKASRIWLLPGGEFAFLNALLFLGPVPVVYLPAFYYPKDELIFNPVFGNTMRKGYFIETTTYVLGRKPLDKTSDTDTSDTSNESDASEKLKALFNFVKPSTLKEQKHEGLMLHNLDKDFSGSTNTFVKVLADYYSNLGVLAGVEGVISPQKYISNIEFNARVGVSNTVYKTSTGNYTPFGTSGTRTYDHSSLLGLDLPFRYTANIKMSMDNPFSLTMSVPFFSDPYFQNDFLDERSEYMDWISYLISNASGSKEEEEHKTINETSSFTWTLDASYSVPLPDIVKPYLSTINISLNSNVAFATMTTADEELTRAFSEDLIEWKKYTPERQFYYPGQITPVNLTATISGTIFDTEVLLKKKNKKKTPHFIIIPKTPDLLLTKAEKDKIILEKTQQNTDTAKGDANLETGANTGSETTDSTGEAGTATGEAGEAAGGVKVDFLATDPFPMLNTPSDGVSLVPGLAFKSTYSIKPNLQTQLAYSSVPLKKSSDFDWKVMRSSMYKYSMPITIDNMLSYAGEFIKFNASFSYEPVWQEHPYINTEADEGGYTEDGKFSLQKTDYAAEQQDLTNTNTISFKPFCYIPLIKDTGVAWRTRIRLIRTEFESDKYKTKDDKPSWIYHTAYWMDEEAVTTNDIDFTLAFSEMDGKFTQNHTVTMTMQPQAEAYYSRLSLTFPYITTSVGTGIKKASTAEDAEWVRQPVVENFTFSIFDNKLRLNQSYTYNLEEYHDDTFNCSLSWTALTANYVMQYTNIYEFDSEKGWTIPNSSDKKFQPYTFTLSYAPPMWYFYTWKNRISFGLGIATSITADLLRPTSSSFIFSPSLSFKIHEILTVTFSATSKNQVIYRYFVHDGKLSGETNLFIDLFNSFRFDKDELREASGFKLQSLQVDVTHELHDWDLKFQLKMSPRLVNKKYQMNPYISLSIVWRPMSAMQTQIIHDDEKNEWILK